MTCYRPKLTVWPGKLFFLKRKYLKTPKTMDNFADRLTLEGTGGQTDDTRSTLVPPWKVWSITVQTSYWEGQWHQNCGYTSPILFFGGTDKEISEKRNFFVNRSVPKNFNGKIFRGMYWENLYALRIPKTILIFLTLFWSPKVGWVGPNKVR